MLTFVLLKRSIAILLLILFAYGTIGYFISFEVEKYAIRKEVKNRIKKGLPDDKLVIIKDNAFNTELNWVEDDEEFRLNGKMYDVVSKRIEGNTIYYSCIIDAEEEELFEELEQQVDNALNDSGKKKNENNLKDYIPAERFSPKQVGVTFMSNTYSPNNYQSINLELVTPPPPYHS